MRHLQNMAKVMLVTGLIVAYGYIDGSVHGVVQREPVREVHDAEPHDRAVLRRVYWIAHPLQRRSTPQALWFKRVRTNVPALFVIALIVNIGMWLERFVIVVTSLHRDFLPSSWGMYQPTFWDWSTFVGTIGLFLALLFLFLRFLPMISIFEMRDAFCRKRRSRRTGTTDGARAPSAIYGLMAEFDDPDDARRGRASARTHAAIGAWTRTRRSRSKSCTRRSGCSASRLPLIVLHRRHRRLPRRLSPAVLGRRRSPIRSTSAAGRSTAGRRSSRSPSSARSSSPRSRRCSACWR